MKKTLIALFAVFALAVGMAFGAGASVTLGDNDVGYRIEKHTPAGIDLKNAPATAATIQLGIESPPPIVAGISIVNMSNDCDFLAYFWPSGDSKASLCKAVGHIDTTKRIQHARRYWRRC